MATIVPGCESDSGNSVQPEIVCDAGRDCILCCDQPGGGSDEGHPSSNPLSADLGEGIGEGKRKATRNPRPPGPSAHQIRPP